MNQDPNTSDPVVVEVRAADPYPVVIGRGLLPEILEECSSSRTVAIFYQPPLAQTAETLRDGWLHTGDIGEIDPDGCIRITDRKKDLFKTSNGKYVAPSTIESMFKGICPYASQLVIEGDGRKFVSALITLDEEGIKGWAEQNGMADADYRTIVTSQECRDMVQGYVDQLNGKLNRWEQIKRFIILPRDLTVEEGEITPSLKLKRKVVATKYKDELDELYVD